MKISIPHTLGKEEALKRVKDFGCSAPKKFSTEIKDLKINWIGTVGEFSFKALKTNLSGTVIVDANKLIIDGKIPLAFLLFTKKIEDVITYHAKGILK